MSSVTFPGSDFAAGYDIVCFSHLRWDFVYQRPQHLLSRFAKRHDVLFIEEPVFHAGPAEFVITEKADRLSVAVPHIPSDTDSSETDTLLRKMVDDLLTERGLE